MNKFLKVIRNNKSAVVLFVLAVLVIGLFFGNTYLSSKTNTVSDVHIDPTLHSKFTYLSTHGNSSCSGSYLSSIPTMDDSERLQGSCCSPMVESRYVEQVTNLKKYKDVAIIPSDPYNIPAKLAKQLLTYDKTITPSSDEQRVLDAAVAASPEKGYCCCRCWRWYVYEGLSKYLVRNQHFTAQQITDVLANSDGCGGAS